MKTSTLLKSLLVLTLGVALPATLAAAAPLTGKDAYVTWKEAAPGVSYLIRPGDLPPPMAEQSVSAPPGVVAMPSGAMPKVPDGFHVELLASGVEGPRAIRTAPNGDLFIAASDVGEVRILHLQGDATKPAETAAFATGLNQPYGIAFYPPGPNPEWVYVANTNSIVRFPYKNGDQKASAAPEIIVPSLPVEYHWTRDIAFSPDGKQMFVSVGSGSNIAEDVKGDPEGGIAAFAASHKLGEMWGAEQRRAAVLSFNPDGTNEQIFATGLRNCSGLTVQPANGALWCVVNERDELGDNLVPDYATHVVEGGFYGWPWYYIGGNEDPRAPLKGQRPDLAGKVTVPDILLQAHSAPLQIAFYEGSMFPAEYKGSAFIAMHGSWNRGTRTGYKVVRAIFDSAGKATGEYQDFMTGFVLSDAEVWARPVGVTVAADGSLIVTDDGNGTVWRVTHDAAPS